MALAEDLQRCRRMVASMRGLVMITSLRMQLLKEARQYLQVRDERLRQPASSPRVQYLRHFQTERIRIIQRRWRKHRWQRLIVNNMKLERKWRRNRGNLLMEQSATTIQRIVRGHCVRKRLRELAHPHFVDVAIIATHQSKLERLRSERMQFHKRLKSKVESLQKAIVHLESARSDKASTEAKIATTPISKAGLYIDAKLLDGTVVRMEAQQLLLHQTSEVDRVETAIQDLTAQVQAMKQTDAVVLEAAKRIQSQSRLYLARKNKLARQSKERKQHARVRVSSEHCLQRMNAGFLKRQQQTWHHCAMILTGLYHIIIAKKLLHRHRQQRAVALIERIYRQKTQRMDAHASVRWQRTKLQTYCFCQRRMRRLKIQLFHKWCNAVITERRRQLKIKQALTSGHAKWVTFKALKLQRLFRRAMAIRCVLTEEIVPCIHAVLLHTIESIVATAASPSDQFIRFYQLIVQEMHSWRSPPMRLYFLARRYNLSLDGLPIDDVWTWILHLQQRETLATFSSSSSYVGWWYDLRTPYTTRTLRFLAHLSQFYDRHDTILHQSEHIWLHYEAIHTMRQYLIALFAHGRVAFRPATTFSAQQRQQAIQRLQALNNEENTGDHEGSPLLLLSETPAETPFSIFHSVWTDLCEQCLALQADRLARVCETCGHRRLERSTAAQASHAAVAAQPLRLPYPDHGEPHGSNWIHETERCDFLVVHAFFHALAPRGHVHRELYQADTLWKIALAKAYEPVRVLYEQHGICTLNDLMVTKGLRALDDVLPMPVINKLELFVRLLQQELVTLDDHEKQ